jgi:hypothetical protein
MLLDFPCKKLRRYIPIHNSFTEKIQRTEQLPGDELQATEEGVAGDAQSEKPITPWLFSAKFEV